MRNQTATLKALSVGTCAYIGPYVIRRVSRTEWRIGEVRGDWLLSGSLAEIVARIQK